MEGVRYATTILTRAVTLDTSGRYTEALVCYQEGLQLLLEGIKSIPDDETRTKLRTKAHDYMERGEKLKKLIESLQSQGKYREQFSVEEDSKGHSYDSVFSRFMDESVTGIEVEDPFIRSPHQCDNFVRFTELACRKCKNLKCITLTTGQDTDTAGQSNRLSLIRNSALQQCKVEIVINFSNSLHDREIRLNNGWVIKIGRGLDYFKKIDRFHVGHTDFDLRPCRATTVDIFHRKDLVRI